MVSRQTLYCWTSARLSTVSHEKLIYKLHGYGIRGKTLRWIKSFLNGRSQTVVLEGDCSEEVPVTSGIPQRSVLGPILFLAYINDLPEKVKSQVGLFADDTAAYLAINSLADSRQLQDDLDILQDREVNWNMEFNPGKCKVIRVTRSRSPLPTTYTLHNQTLEVVQCARYLGVDTEFSETRNPAYFCANFCFCTRKISFRGFSFTLYCHQTSKLNFKDVLRASEIFFVRRNRYPRCPKIAKKLVHF